MARSKYGARKVVFDGIEFASKKEARRYSELKIMEASGEIKCLRLQFEFELIPAQFAPPIKLKNGKEKRGKCLERKCSYIADFCYFRADTGELVVEDTKGFKTDVYRLKRKLFLWRYHIQITEV